MFNFHRASSGQDSAANQHEHEPSSLDGRFVEDYHRAEFTCVKSRATTEGSRREASIKLAEKRGADPTMEQPASCSQNDKNLAGTGTKLKKVEV